MKQAREHAGQALRLQWGALEMALRALAIALRVSGCRSWGWARVRGYRARVRARRALRAYFAKRRAARVRKLAVVVPVIVLLGILAAHPGYAVTLTAATGITGIAAARLAPGKVLKADTRKLAGRLYGDRG